MILAIDIGSSSVRGVLFDRTGAQVLGAESRHAHRFTVSPDGRVEADADRLFDLVVRCIDEATAKSAGSAVDGVAFCTFWHSVLGVSRRGHALTPVLTWADSRGADAADRLRGMVDPDASHQRTGCRFHPSYLPAKLLWLKENQPALFREADWWCSIGEYCLHRIFGRKVCSLSMASGTGLFDRRSLRWDGELLGALGVEESRLSPLGDMESPLGEPAKRFADRWPGLRGVPWFPALADGACSNIGSGCAGPSRAAVMVGTTGAMRVVREAGPVRIPRGLWCYLVDRRRTLVGGALGDGGNLYEWMSAALDLGIAGDALDAALLTAQPAGHGLTVLPFLTGERSPGWNPRARGAVLGLGLRTRPLDILQAGMEAVAYRFAAVSRLLAGAAPGIRELVGTGAALLQSGAWPQMIADVLGLPVTLAGTSEASSRGAALLALEALGLIPGIDEAEPLRGRTFSPRRQFAEAHRAAAQEQERLYAAVFGSPG